jgi:uncharacterized membrane protein (DUF4010 family)
VDTQATADAAIAFISYLVGLIKGAFGTWATGITKHFLSKAALDAALLSRFEDGGYATEYVLRFFKNAL